MFKRVGKEIRIWAKVLVILQMIPIVIAGIVCAVAGFMYDTTYGIMGVVAGILFILLGYFLARLGAIMLYSWGEVVERVVCIDEKLEKMERYAHHAPVAPVTSPYAAPSYGYAPSTPAPAPVSAPTPAPAKPVPSQTRPAPAPAKPAAAPVKTAPAASARMNDDLAMEDEYTVALRPTPKSTYSAPAQSAPTEWTCPNCGQRNSADGNWCRNCGTKKNV